MQKAQNIFSLILSYAFFFGRGIQDTQKTKYKEKSNPHYFCNAKNTQKVHAQKPFENQFKRHNNCKAMKALQNIHF